jgi:hypothetical protein
MFGDFPNERALRLEAVSIAKETTANLSRRDLTSVARDIKQLLMGKTLAVKPNLKEKVWGNNLSF